MKCFKGDISVDISLVVVSGERLAGPSTKYKLEPWSLCSYEKVWSRPAQCLETGVSGAVSSMTGASRVSGLATFTVISLSSLSHGRTAYPAQVGTGLEHNNLQSPAQLRQIHLLSDV